MKRGFTVAVSLAMRYRATMLRGGRHLEEPNIGALPGKAKKRCLATIAEGEGDRAEDEVDFDFFGFSARVDGADEAEPPAEMLSPLRPAAASDFDTDVRKAVSGVELSMLLERGPNHNTYVFRMARCKIIGGKRAGRCPVCSDRRGLVFEKLKRLFETREAGEPSKFAPHKYIAQSPGLTQQVLRQRAKEVAGLKQRLYRLAKIDREKNGVVIEEVPHQLELANVFEKVDKVAAKIFADDPVARMVWQNQLDNCRSAVEHGGRRCARRYSPATIKLAIVLSTKLGKEAYDQVRKLFLLPTGRHLQSYNVGSDDAEGVMLEMIGAMKAKADDLGYNGVWQRCGCVTFDAMTIKGGVWFEYHTGRVLGFPYNDGLYETCMSEFKSYAQSLGGEKACHFPTQFDGLLRLQVHEPEVAKHYLVYYYVGLGVSNFAFPVARYAMTSIKAPDLRTKFLCVVTELARRTFIVVAAVFDGAQENRTFQKISATRAAAEFLVGVVVPWDTSFPVAMDHPVFGRKYPIFLMSDTPHEVKKVVNTLENSNPNNNKKRMLQHLDSNGDRQPMCLDMVKDAWLDFEGLMTESLVCGAAPLTRTKLKREHFEKNAFSRMRVYLAAQVLSNTVCCVIDQVTAKKPNKRLLYGPLRALCSNMDRFLDIMNGRREKGYKNIDTTDARELKELGEIMKWFECWFKSIHEDRQFAHLAVDEKKSAFLPEGCWFDLQSIIKGVTAFSIFYLRKFQDTEPIMIVQRRLMQDIVEHHFAHIRQSCGGSTQPSVVQCEQATSRSATNRILQDKKSNAGQAPLIFDPSAAIFHNRNKKRSRVNNSNC